MSDAVARTDVSNLDFIGAKDDDGDGSGAVRCTVSQTVTINKPNTQLFTGQMPFLSPTISPSSEWKKSRL